MESNLVLKKDQKNEFNETNREYISNLQSDTINYNIDLDNINLKIKNINSEYEDNHFKIEKDNQIEINEMNININDKIQLDPFFHELKRKNSQQIQQDLLGMGFELNIINNLIMHLEIKTTEQAIEYASKIDGKWNHPFINLEVLESNNNFTNNDIFFSKYLKCGICGETEELHYLNSKENLLTKKIDPKENLLSDKKISGNFSAFKKFANSDINVNKSRQVFSDIYNNNLYNLEDLNRFQLFNNSVLEQRDQNMNLSDLINEKNFGENIEFIDFAKMQKKQENLVKSDNGKVELEKPQVPVKECEICMGEISNEFILKCEHFFCKSCLEDYLNNKINGSEIRDIHCPRGKDSCSYKFEEEIIKKLISKMNLDRFYKFSRRAEIIKMKGVSLCPIPDCESFAITEMGEFNNLRIDAIKEKFENFINNKNKFQFNSEFNESNIKEIKQNLSKNIGICFDNKHEVCLKCKHLAHIGKNCEKGMDIEFNKFVGNDSHFVKRCPKCNFYIQKNKGCNHMTCANIDCRYEFCWICMRKYSSYHYRIILSPCFQMQNSDQESFIVKHPWLVYPRWIGLMILMIILFCFAVVFGPLIILFLIGNKMSYRIDRIFRNDSCGKCLNKCFYFMTYLLMGIGLYPLFFYLICIIPLVLFVVLINAICKKYCE